MFPQLMEEAIVHFSLVYNVETISLKVDNPHFRFFSECNIHSKHLKHLFIAEVISRLESLDFLNQTVSSTEYLFFKRTMKSYFRALQEMEKDQKTRIEQFTPNQQRTFFENNPQTVETAYFSIGSNRRIQKIFEKTKKKFVIRHLSI